MQNRKADNVTIKGYSHILENKECQDSSVCWQGKQYDAVIVCDGHGGEKYFRSKIGSYLACKIGKEKISEFMGILLENKELKNSLINSRDADSLLSRLEKSIIQSWYQAALEDKNLHPFDDDPAFLSLSEDVRKSLFSSPIKAYGSTFIAAVWAEDFFFILKLGDGNVCIQRKNGDVEFADSIFPDLKDENLEFNITSSLCDSDADAEFRHCIKKLSDSDSLRGLLLSTDGVKNCYKSEEGYLSFVKNIFNGYFEQKCSDAHDELEAFLPIITEKGSGDDLSVALICIKK